MTTARLAFTAVAAWMVMLSATPVAQAQFAYRCTEGGKTTYSQAPCQGSDVAVISTRPNSIDASAERAHRARASRRAMNNAILDYIDAQSRTAPAPDTSRGLESDRRRAFEQATTPYPGSRGGLTRSQRETAARLASTQAERDAVMREATTVIPGANGLTASQLDTQRRMQAVNRGEPLPPTSRYASPPPAPITIPAPPPAPRVITHCAGGTCHDNQGGVYHRHGNAPTMTGPTGTTCTRAGNVVHCP